MKKVKGYLILALEIYIYSIAAVTSYYLGALALFGGEITIKIDF